MSSWRTDGSSRASAATEPSRDPLSTTTSSGSPALVSASTDRRHVTSSGPVSKFTTTAAQRATGSFMCARLISALGSWSVDEAVLHEGPQRRETVAPRDLLPLVRLASRVGDRDLVDANPASENLGRHFGLELEPRR